MPHDAPQPPSVPEPIVPPPGHAPIQTNLRLVVRFGIALILVGILVQTLIAVLYVSLTHHFARADAPGFFNAMRPAPPPPRLQIDEIADLQKLRLHDEKELNSYGWVDRAHNVVHIPIDRAMELYLARQQPPATQPGPGGGK